MMIPHQLSTDRGDGREFASPIFHASPTFVMRGPRFRGRYPQSRLARVRRTNRRARLASA